MQQNRVRSGASELFFGAVIAIEKLFLLKNRRHHNHLQTCDLSALLPDHAVHPFSDNDAHLVKALNLDVLVTFGGGSLVRNISGAARLGAIALDHSEDRVHRVGPAGFWDVYLRNDTTGFTIERLTEALTGAEQLLRGQVGTQFYFLLNQASLFEKSSYYLARLIEKTAATGELPEVLPSTPFPGSAPGFPRPHQTIIYLAGLIRLAARKALRKALRIDFRWNVAFVHADWKHAVLARAAVIENPPRRFLADPFVITRNGNEFCYVEDYDEAIGRGRISVYELGFSGATYVGVALEESFHLSFPYLFDYGGELYMCPETSGNRDVRIYKCLDFPLRWKLEKVIMKDVSAVDSMLFEKDGRWWMFTNIDPAEWGDFSLELRIFSAKSPLDDEWIPHPANPLFIDASRTRNGGMVKDGTRLFRVAQGKGFDMYGKQTSVNEIIKLDDKGYIENCVRVIKPTFRKGISGTHHLHSNGKTTIFDFT